MPYLFVKLTTAGVDTGPFNLYSNSDGFLSAFESNISKASILSGIVVDAPVGTIMIRITSVNQRCSNYINLPVYADHTSTTTLTTLIPPSTSTTSSTSTIAPISCGDPVNYSGGPGWPTSNNIFVGSATGQISISADADGLPDRFIVRIGGVVVIDTGFQGNSEYNTSGFSRNTFRNWINGRVDPITGIAYPDFVNYPFDGYPNVCCGNNPVVTNGIKTTSDEVATVEVYGSSPQTGWRYTLFCAGANTSTTTVTTTII